MDAGWLQDGRHYGYIDSSTGERRSCLCIIAYFDELMMHEIMLILFSFKMMRHNSLRMLFESEGVGRGREMESYLE